MKESIAQTFEQLLKEGVKLQKEAKIAQQRANSSGLLDASRKIVSRNPKATSVLTQPSKLFSFMQGHQPSSAC